MRAIVEESKANDSFAMFDNITKHYENHYAPLANRAAITYFIIPHRSGMTLSKYSVKATQIIR